ncbi:MAG: hypothetical protein RJA98_3414 [Pseudomonadota bacterium]|jgi:hypothetical protein
MFDLLMSADMMLDDPDGMAALLVQKLGVHAHPNWRQAFDDHPYIAHFLRVHKSLAVAPTRIEPQWHLDKPNPGDPLFHDFLESLKAYQGAHRPMITHSIVLALRGDKFDTLLDKLMRRRQRFRMAQRTEAMPFDRMWLGVTPEDPRYEPSVDGGLCIEIMPIEPLQMPPDTFAVPAPQPRELAPGQMVRVTARGFLVRNLDDTLRRVSANLDWEPTGPVRSLDAEGYRCATMGFTLPNSARLDVIEASRWSSDAGRYLHTWGPGPHYIRIAVNGLAAKADDLKARGVRHTWIESSEAVGGKSLIRVDPAELRGQLFEFEEL